MLTTASKIDDLDIAEFVVGEEHILRFDVAVDHTFVFQELQRLEYLLRDEFYLQGGVHGLVILLVALLLKLMQADA